MCVRLWCILLEMFRATPEFDIPRQSNLRLCAIFHASVSKEGMPTFIGVECYECTIYQVIQKPKSSKFQCRGTQKRLPCFSYLTSPLGG